MKHTAKSCLLLDNHRFCSCVIAHRLFSSIIFQLPWDSIVYKGLRHGEVLANAFMAQQQLHFSKGFRVQTHATTGGAAQFDLNPI